MEMTAKQVAYSTCRTETEDLFVYILFPIEITSSTMPSFSSFNYLGSARILLFKNADLAVML